MSHCCNVDPMIQCIICGFAQGSPIRHYLSKMSVTPDHSRDYALDQIQLIAPVHMQVAKVRKSPKRRFSGKIPKEVFQAKRGFSGKMRVCVGLLEFLRWCLRDRACI